MLLIPETPSLPPDTGLSASLDQLGKLLMERSPALGQWGQHGLYQAFQLKRMTEQLYIGLEQNPQSPIAQRQILRLMVQRREKDLQAIAEGWGLNSLEIDLLPAPCQGLEHLIYEYRWQQRTYQCLAWINELQNQSAVAQVFQKCADNLYFDLGCLQLAHARNIQHEGQ